MTLYSKWDKTDSTNEHATSDSNGPIKRLFRASQSDYDSNGPITDDDEDVCNNTVVGTKKY